MAIVGKIINEGPGHVNVRSGEVLADIVTDKDFFKLEPMQWEIMTEKTAQNKIFNLLKRKLLN